MRLRHHTFVVTGAGAGIGRELVRQLLASGARVAAVDLSDKALKALKRELAKYNNKLSTHTVDISNRKAVEKLPDIITAVHGVVDGVINNAGIIQPFVTLDELTYEDIERVMNVNFYGTLAMVKSFLPHLIDRPESYIVNVSSMGGFLPVPGQGIYGASKAAIKLMTESLYAELLDTPVHVSTVFPGATATDITKNSNISTNHMSEDAKTPKMLPPAKAAEIILKGIEKNKPLIYTGSDSKMMSILYRISPVFATRLIAKQMRSLLK